VNFVKSGHEDVERRLAFHVEEWGLAFEQSGLPRMAGRALGWLLVSPDEASTAAELARALSASKASISTTTRLLERFGFIEAVGRPGDRLRRFRLRPDAFTRQMEQKLGAVSMWRELAARGLTILRGSGPRRSERLKEVHDFYVFLEREFPRLLEKWRKERRR